MSNGIGRKQAVWRTLDAFGEEGWTIYYLEERGSERRIVSAVFYLPNNILLSGSA
ncbi:hypothetical protein [Klebsiella quasivariicola]|uniref:hypothetical protein n=1 Tax=Klebsiella quasivariicola TaxID=2026240 RepID=UPI00247B241A|nr:hypothetical protein [Klebsiella quasivariicola]